MRANLGLASIASAAVLLAGCSLLVDPKKLLDPDASTEAPDTGGSDAGSVDTGADAGPDGGALDASEPVDGGQQITILVADHANHRLAAMSDLTGAGWRALPATSRALSSPRRISFDSLGRLYVADTDNYRILRMDDLSGKNLVAFGSYGVASNATPPSLAVGKFAHPSVVYVDPSNRILVVDNENQVVVAFDDMTGANWNVLDLATNRPLDLTKPHLWLGDVAMDKDSRLYRAGRKGTSASFYSELSWTTDFSTWNQVSATFAQTVTALSVDPATKDLYYVRTGATTSTPVYQHYNGTSYDAPVSFGNTSTPPPSSPLGIASDGVGNVYLADTGNNRIVYIVRSGSNFYWQGSMGNASGQAGSGQREFNAPFGIQVGPKPNNDVFVADTVNDRIVSFSDVFGTGWTSFTNTAGRGINEFKYPEGVAFGPDGKIYLADTANNRIVRMDDPSGAGWTVYAPASAPRALARPTALAVTAGGIYIADTGNNRVVLIDSMQGNVWAESATPGSGGSLSEPRGVAVDSTGRIYVADTGNNRIVRMSAINDTNWLTVGGTSAGSGDNQFNRPAGIAVDPAATYVYVSDEGNNRLVRLTNATDLDNRFTGFAAYGSQGSGADEFASPRGIKVGSDGKIYVADHLNNRIVRVDAVPPNAGGWTELGESGSGARQFIRPADVAVR